jgi:hypothetical protein
MPAIMPAAWPSSSRRVVIVCLPLTWRSLRAKRSNLVPIELSLMEIASSLRASQ